MSFQYSVNWTKGSGGNEIKEGDRLVVKVTPPTLAFAFVVLDNYRKVGNKWTGFPVLVAQENKESIDGVLSIKVARQGKVLRGKNYLLRTWAADEETGQANFWADEFRVV